MPIRPALPHEAESLTRIVMAAKAHWGYSAAQLDAFRPALEVPPGQLASEPAFVLETDGRAVGFYSLRFIDGRCELDNLWVLPAEMGHGHGRALVAHARRVARTLGVRELHIDADPHAESFYVHCGAVAIGTVAAPIEGQPGRVRPQLRLACDP